MEILKVILEDTGEEMSIPLDDIQALNEQYVDNILGANNIEGREKTTYWRDNVKMEEYRLARLAEVQ